MRLRSIELNNWKAYRRARVRLPDAVGRPVVVIEGNNGAGKTSLLEAMTLCLYGRAALPLVARASATGRQSEPYDAFLERALSMDARGKATRMSVLMRFELDERQIAVERAWHFGASGRHRRDDEEVRLFDGPEGDLVELPAADAERNDAVRAWIASELVPESLAGFFLLDGEHLERMAGSAAETLIRDAVDTALGSAALRSLAVDLRSYARERRRVAVPPGVGSDAARAALETLEAREMATSKAVADAVAQLQPLRASRDAVVRRIGALHGESYRTFKALFEQREGIVRQRDSERDELRRLLVGDLALALTGPALRDRVVTHVLADAEGASARRDRDIAHAALERFLTELATEDPSLPDRHRPSIAAAWERTWSEAGGTSREARFSHLGEDDRHAVALLLSRLADVDAANFAALARSVASRDDAIAEIEQEVARQRGLEGDAKALADELSHVQGETSGLEERHAALVIEQDDVRRRLTQARMAYEQSLEQASEAAPILRRAARAEAFASLADRFALAAMPAALSSLSERITAAYVAMAHKSVVRSVRVSVDGRVEMLDAQGRDLRGIDASAGESQILALAVMSALASLAPGFPLVIDTPLARLDPRHRVNVLRHFAGEERQLVLLTHPAEIGPAEEAVIADRVAGTIGLSPSSPTPTLAATA